MRATPRTEDTFGIAVNVTGAAATGMPAISREDSGASGWSSMT